MLPRRPPLPPTGVWVGQFWGATADGARAAVHELEEHGYGMLWISESFGREVFAFAATLLAASERMIVASGIANLWARDPVAMMNGTRTLAEAFPRRFVLGIGVSHPGRFVEGRGHNYHRPLTHTREYLEAMGEVEYTAPEPRDPAPIVVGALGDGMLTLSGELADGAHPYLVTPDHTRHARALLGDEPILAPDQKVIVSTDSESARAAARESLGPYLRLDNYRRSLLRQGFEEQDLADGGSDALVEALVAIGDVGSVARRVQAHLDAGADHVAVNPQPAPGRDPLAQLLELAPELTGA